MQAITSGASPPVARIADDVLQAGRSAVFCLPPLPGEGAALFSRGRLCEPSKFQKPREYPERPMPVTM